MTIPQRVFHEVMGYACSKCGLKIDFYLEDGCEGPRDVPYKMTIDHGPLQGKEITWFRTNSGRKIIPVPFVAGGCPKCQGKPPWEFSGGVLEHTGNDKRGIHLTEIPKEAGYFAYPLDVSDPHTCGKPYFPPFAVEEFKN